MKDKVEAVYELRAAAENHGRVQAQLEREPSARMRDAALDAQLAVEEKTAQAIEACHHCGLAHCEDPAHAPQRGGAKVIDVAFGEDRGEKNG